MYATAQDLLMHIGSRELSRLLLDDNRRLQPQHIEAAINGDTSEYSQDEQNAAATALDRAENVLNAQCAYMDGYIGKRYELPLSESDKAIAPQLQSCCIALVRSALADDNSLSTEQIQEQRKYWNRWLNQISEGKTLLPFTQVSSGTGTEQKRLSGKMHSSIDWGDY